MSNQKLEKVNSFISPYHSKRHSKIDSIIIHYISAKNVNEKQPFHIKDTLELLTKPIVYFKNNERKQVTVSAHYCIDREGIVYQLVDEGRKAWHSGKSSLHGRHDDKGTCNDFSIGIELFGGDWIDFTDNQYDSLVKLIDEIRSYYKIPDKYIVGHDFIAPMRKVDPGKNFDWDRLFSMLKPIAKAGVIITEGIISKGLIKTIWRTFLNLFRSINT